MLFWAVSKTTEGKRWRTIKPALADATAMAKEGLRGVGVKRWDDNGQRFIREWRNGALRDFDPLLILSKASQKAVRRARKAKVESMRRWANAEPYANV